MSTGAPPQLDLNLVVTYPRKAAKGAKYLVTVDLEVKGGEWPYGAEEEYALDCIVNAAPWFQCRTLESAGILLHRFGGTYGPARFVLTAVREAEQAPITITLVNRSGMPIMEHEFADVEVQAEGEAIGGRTDVIAELEPGRPGKPPVAAPTPASTLPDYDRKYSLRNAQTQVFRLELEFVRTIQPDDPYGFHFAPQVYLLRSSGGGYQSASFPWGASLLEDLQRAGQKGADRASRQRLGEVLSRFLMPLGWADISRQILSAVQQGGRVHLTIRSAAAELYALPWELLTLNSGQHLAELPSVLLRYEWPESTTKPEAPLPRTGGGRILLAWSAAGGAVPAAEHERAIEQACQAGFHPFDPTRDVLSNVSPNSLQKVLSKAQQDKQPISVLHLLVHGQMFKDSYGLVFDGGELAEPIVVDAGRLLMMLGPFADMVRLVVLIVCDGGNANQSFQLGSIAQALHRLGMAAVVASRYPMSVPGGLLLTQSLYAGLLSCPDSLESALLFARRQLGTKLVHYGDWASLQLYTRAADGDDTSPLVFRPYPGLSAFGREDSRFFFGREELVDKLLQRCRELLLAPQGTRLLAILGARGSGKTSVVRAGLLTALERRPLPELKSLRVELLRPGNRPMQELQECLAKLAPASSRQPVLVVVDPFEETYTLCPNQQERNDFVAELLRASRDRFAAVILIVGADFQSVIAARHKELSEVIAAQHELVGPLPAEALRRVIEEPARLAGRTLEDGLVDRLLHEAQEYEAALPVIQLAMVNIWEGMLAGKSGFAVFAGIDFSDVGKRRTAPAEVQTPAAKPPAEKPPRDPPVPDISDSAAAEEPLVNLLLCDANDAAHSLWPADLPVSPSDPTWMPRLSFEPSDQELISHLDDPNDLTVQRWGIVAPEGSFGSQLLEVATKLIKKRQDQQRGPVQIYRAPRERDASFINSWYQEIILNPGRGKAQPPKYLLILGDLNQVSLMVQRVLGSRHYVGRLAFDGAQGYAQYIDKLLKWEEFYFRAERGNALFFVPDDAAVTRAGHASFIAPTAELLQKKTTQKVISLGIDKGFQQQYLLGMVESFRKSVLLSLSQGAAASVDGWRSESEKRSKQGAMGFGKNGFLTAQDLSSRPFLPGGIWLMLASYGAGVPESSAYRPWLRSLHSAGSEDDRLMAVLKRLQQSEREPFVSAIPKAVLANPDGPLAFIGAADLAFTSFWSPKSFNVRRRRPETFASLLSALLSGSRCGAAFQQLIHLADDIDVDLSRFESRFTDLSQPEDVQLGAYLWMLRQELSSYILLGDPAAAL